MRLREKNMKKTNMKRITRRIKKTIATKDHNKHQRKTVKEWS
jgi:hypothetical protein